MSRRLDENEKIYCFMILFPIFWPFIPVVMLVNACNAIGDWWRTRRMLRKRDKEGPDNV